MSKVKSSKVTVPSTGSGTETIEEQHRKKVNELLDDFLQDFELCKKSSAELKVTTTHLADSLQATYPELVDVEDLVYDYLAKTGHKAKAIAQGNQLLFVWCFREK